MFKYKVSVIVPIYNVEKYIKDCLDSLIAQTIDKSLLEALLIIDGSPDDSESVCRQYAEKYPFFKVFTKENEGLSRTRNYGIKRAEGKYIVYLDPDDKLTPDSLKNLVEFFDKHENEVDIVTYKITPVFNGVQSEKLHYRYQYLHGEGVYDLTRPENFYISQTNVNICVLNKGDDNILFDVTENFRHEDQKYNLDIVRKKMKIGYCAGANYLYTKNPSGITGATFYAYYIFETTTAFWENLFADYPDKAPPYIQAMYLNDINWKIRTDILLPYNYEKERFDEAVGRLVALLRRVDDSIILNHPAVEPAHKYFFIGLKDKNSLSVKSSCYGVSITKGDDTIFFDKSVPLSICKFKARDDFVFIDGFMRSPIFSFVDKPLIAMRLTGESESVDAPVEPESSSWDYFHAKIKTNVFWRIRVNWDYKKYRAVFFTVRVCGKEIPTRLEFITNTPFDKQTKRTSVFRRDYEFTIYDSGFESRPLSQKNKTDFYKRYNVYMALKKPRTLLQRKLCGDKIPPGRRAWLYYDCKNVLKDNGYYQFAHDFEKDDGVERYYVVNDDINRDSLFSRAQRKNVVKFGSLKHKRLFLGAEKILTAFGEHDNYNPFPYPLWPYYTDLFDADIIYLQHGVLHAFLPWKYSSDRMNAFDFEVVSTDFEVRNLTENYGFRRRDLIESGMPRYDLICDKNATLEKKILFAPTWRKYLVGVNSDGSLFPSPDKFIKSDFFKETYKFLHSEKLEKFLEENDWRLDFKLHPIFADYAPLYELKGRRVSLADRSVDETSYAVFITDFSSFCFDFVYLKKTVMYFVPDNDMFKAGMNDYRKLDLPLEEGFGPIANSADEAVEALIEIVERGGSPSEPYRSRADGFFIHYDQNCRERIYNAVKNGK